MRKGPFFKHLSQFSFVSLLCDSSFKIFKGHLYLCTVDSLDERPGLVAGPDGGLEEAVHVHVVHLYDAGRTVRWIPPCQKNEKLTDSLIFIVTSGKFFFYYVSYNLKIICIRKMVRRIPSWKVSRRIWDRKILIFFATCRKFLFFEKYAVWEKKHIFNVCNCQFARGSFCFLKNTLFQKKIIYSTFAIYWLPAYNWPNKKNVERMD